MKTITFIFLIFISNHIFCQDLKILHLRGGDSEIVGHNIKYEEYFSVGKTVHIRIKNPNPFIYNYEFTIDSSKITYEIPTWDKWLEELSKYKSDAELTNGRLHNDVPQPSDTLLNSFKKILTAIEAVEKENKKLNKYILNSDDVVDDNTAESLFNKVKIIARTELKAIDINEDEIKNEKNSLTGNDIKFFKILEESYRTMVTNYNTKLKAFTDSKPTLDFYFTLKENQILTLKLKVSKKYEFGNRDVGDSIITIILKAKYKWKKFEFLPVTALAYGGTSESYYLQNGLVAAEQSSETHFLPSVLLNFPAHKLGENGEFSIGYGVGISYSNANKDFRNVHFNVVGSYTEKVRLSLGFGFAQMRDGLKSGYTLNQVAEGDLLQIDDLNRYNWKPTLLFGVNLTGFSFGK